MRYRDGKDQASKVPSLHQKPNTTPVENMPTRHVPSRETVCTLDLQIHTQLHQMTVIAGQGLPYRLSHGYQNSSTLDVPTLALSTWMEDILG